MLFTGAFIDNVGLLALGATLEWKGPEKVDGG